MKNQKSTKWNLSLEPGYQMIYWSLCWLSFLIGLIAWLEYTEFNWITFLFWMISLLFVAVTKSHYLEAAADQLFFCCLFRRKKQLSLNEVESICYSDKRLVVLYSYSGDEMERFYLSPKQRNRFLTFVSTDHPTIALEERLQTIDK